MEMKIPSKNMKMIQGEMSTESANNYKNRNTVNKYLQEIYDSHKNLRANKMCLK